MRKIMQTSRLFSFWPLQAGGWLGYGAVMTFALLPMPGHQGLILSYLGLVGSEFIASFLLYWLCHVLWRQSVALLPSLAFCGAASYVLATASSLPAVWIQLKAQHAPTDTIWRSTIASGVGASFVLIAWCALYFGIKHYRALQEQTVRLVTSEAAARTAQLQALQYQLQPHFLFNTLNAISTLVVSSQPEMATDMLAKLGTLLRDTLQSPECHTVSLSQELAIIHEYLDIEKVRFGPRLNVSFGVVHEANRAEVPRFLLQPLIENAIRHGIAKRPQGGTIAIRAEIVDLVLHIEVESDQVDNCTTNASSGGVGLRNSTNRLEMLYGSEGKLKTSTAPNGHFLVEVTLPFSQKSSVMTEFLQALPA